MKPFSLPFREGLGVGFSLQIYNIPPIFATFPLKIF